MLGNAVYGYLARFGQAVFCRAAVASKSQIKDQAPKSGRAIPRCLFLILAIDLSLGFGKDSSLVLHRGVGRWCGLGRASGAGVGLAELALPLLNSPKKQGTRELPREFPVTSFNLLTHSLAVTAADAAWAVASASAEAESAMVSLWLWLSLSR